MPASHVNQFVAQIGSPTQDGPPDGIYLVVGHVAPPILLGAPEEIKAHLEDLTANGIEPEVFAKLHFSRARAVELIKVLQTTVERYDASVEARKAKDKDEEL